MARKRILIVDDLRTMLALIPVYLMGFDYEFDTAQDAESALKSARRQRPDLILSDVRMKGMDGIELCQTVRADPQLRDVPFLLMTAATGDPTLPQQGQAAGAAELLQKPLDPERLAAAVSKYLGDTD